MGWLDWLGRRGVPDDPRLPEALERAIYLVEPRLRQAGGRPGQYRESLIRALRHADTVAAAVPGTVRLDQEHYVRDPYVHALFASPDALSNTLHLSRALREYQAADTGDGDIHALMGMRCSEKQGFGMEVTGDIVRRDVAQQTVTFTDHTLSCIASSEAETRALVAWSVFDSLVTRVAQHLTTLRQEQQQRLQARDEYMARLRGSSGEAHTTLERDLGPLLLHLREATERINLDRIPGYFNELLAAPETLVRLEQRQIRLDAMSIVRPQDGDAGNLINFTSLLGLERRQWNVTLVRFPREDLPPLAERLDAAHRWLAIST